ncbi:autotransporter domain-containing protein [Lysobacter fragariae]
MAAALALASMPALAETFSQTIFFGDSQTDSGFYRPALVQVFGASATSGGRFTTNPGLVWSEYLADFYGTDATSAWQINADGSIVAGTGTNFAAGGARVSQGPGNPPISTPVPVGAAPPLTAQVDAYLARTGGRADPNALYTVWGGSNDLGYLVGSMLGLLPPALQITPETFFATAGAQVQLIQQLQGAGARYVLVPTMLDFGATPRGLAAGPLGALGTQLSSTYNTLLFQGIAQAGLRIIPLDTFHLIREVSADPGAYGISPVTAAGGACGTLYSLFCTTAGYVSPDSGNNLFADDVHLSSRGHAIVAQYAESILEAPRQMAVLPNSAAMVGRSRADRVAAHAGKPGEGGMNWWSDVRGDFQRYGGGDLYDGVGPTLTFGVDWSSGNLVYGGFAGYGRQQLDWGHRGGGFDQSDLTLGGFLGWYGEGGGWVNGQLSWSKVDFDIDREVHLGSAVRTHTGSADGRNISLGISGGYEFGEGALRHGPVASLLAQRIDIDGFAESNPELSTSLAYPDQNFDSMIGSIGWQASYAINDHLTPYARLTADREFEDSAEEAFAISQTMPGTGAYAVPGVEFDHDYGTLTFGAKTKLFGLDANLGAAATVGQTGGNNTTVFVTVGSSF